MDKLLPGARSPPPPLVEGPEEEKKEEEEEERKEEEENKKEEEDAAHRPVCEAAVAAAEPAVGPPAPRGAGERLFVFRLPPESGGGRAPKRLRKRNFLNLKKGSVAPTSLP